MVVNLYHKRRGVKTGTDFTHENIERVDNEVCTNRKALSMLARPNLPMLGVGLSSSPSGMEVWRHYPQQSEPEILG